MIEDFKLGDTEANNKRTELPHAYESIFPIEGILEKVVRPIGNTGCISIPKRYIGKIARIYFLRNKGAVVPLENESEKK